MGRTAYGVRGIALRDGDQVVSHGVVHSADGFVLSVTANGYGKRTPLDEYRVQSRGGLGIINIQTSDRNGPVVGALFVSRRRPVDVDDATGQNPPDPRHRLRGRSAGTRRAFV